MHDFGCEFKQSMFRVKTQAGFSWQNGGFPFSGQASALLSLENLVFLQILGDSSGDENGIE